jgi:phenylacetate-CoA ligase
MVVLDDYVYAEVVDPETGNFLSEGQVGELVLTSLRKEASPIVRYKTGDMTSLRTDFSECKQCYGCTVLDRVKLRYDSMIFYKGVKLEPYELRDMIICFAKDKIHNRVRIQISGNSFQERPKILIALKPDVDKSLIDSIQEYLKSETGVSFNIENVPYTYFGEFSSTKDKIVESS